MRKTCICIVCSFLTCPLHVHVFYSPVIPWEIEVFIFQCLDLRPLNNPFAKLLWQSVKSWMFYIIITFVHASKAQHYFWPAVKHDMKFHLLAASSFWTSLIKVLTFSPSADLDLILLRCLFSFPGTGDAVGDSFLPSSESWSLITERTYYCISKKQICMEFSRGNSLLPSTDSCSLITDRTYMYITLARHRYGHWIMLWRGAMVY